MNNIIISQQTCIQIESADLLTANTGFYHVDRIAPFHVLIYCIKGNIFVGEDDVDYKVGPGELLLLKSGHHQRPTARISEGTSWIYAHFYSCEMNLANTDLEDYIGSSPDLVLPKFSRGLHNSITEDKLYKLIETIHSTNAPKRLLVSSLFMDILISLYEDSQSNAQYELADNILRFLENSTAQPLSSGDLEAEFHLTYKYLEHTFKQKTGISIMQYHTKIRIKEISRILRSTDMPISQISEMYGFNDQLYFSRCFKKHMGISPQAYRLGKIVI